MGFTKEQLQKGGRTGSVKAVKPSPLGLLPIRNGKTADINAIDAAVGSNPLAGIEKKIPKNPNPLKDALPVPLKPPQYLNPDGLQVWHSACAALVRAGELLPDFEYILQMLAHSWQEYSRKMKDRVPIPAKEREEMRKLFDVCGLTPSAAQSMDPQNKRRVRPTGAAGEARALEEEEEQNKDNPFMALVKD